MTAFTPSRLGQVDATGSATAMFLAKFAGEVLGFFNNANVTMGLHRVKTIQGTNSYQFPVMGNAVASYHTPGAEIDGQAIKHNKRTINIDDLLISPVFIDKMDELKNHYDVRAEYAKQLGESLALRFDQRVLQTMILAARASATISGVTDGGSVLTNASFASDGEALADGLFDAAQALDEKNISKEGRVCILPPEQYYLLARSTKVINRDWDGSGSFSQGKIYQVAGIRIVESNNVPNSVVAAVTGENNTYNGDFSTTVGIVVHREAVGSVKMQDLAVGSDGFQERYQGELVVAKMAVGTGILRPECAIELKTA